MCTGVIYMCMIKRFPVSSNSYYLKSIVKYVVIFFVWLLTIYGAAVAGYIAAENKCLKHQQRLN